MMKTRGEHQPFLIPLAGLITLALSLLFSGCALREPSPITGEPRIYAFTWEQERELGRRADGQLTEQLGLHDDPELQAYVQTIAAQVLDNSDLRAAHTPEMYLETPFSFRILNSPVVNAFALPGGYVYVTRGLLAHLQNEAQLGVVLGHEIAHVAARHSAQQALRAQIGQLGLIAGAIVGSQVLDRPQMARNILQLGGAAFEVLLAGYSRSAEREADELGLRYAAHSGYAIGEGAGFFEALDRISEREGRALPSWRSTHPDPAARARAVRDMAPALTPPDALLRIGQEEFFARIDGLPLGDDPREGFVQDGVFYHPELQFHFNVPPGWTVRNERAAITLVEPNRQAMLIFEIAPGNSASEAAAALTRVRGLRLLENRPVRINQLTAHHVVAIARADRAEIGLENFFIEHNGRVYSFLGYTTAQRLRHFHPQFMRSISSFRQLTDPKILAAEPARIGILRTPRAAPFSDFLPETLPPGLSARDLAIMNQVDLGETIPEGALLKLPRSR